MLNSWLDRLLVLMVVTTVVLTLFALQYVGPGARPIVADATPPPAASPGAAPLEPASEPALPAVASPPPDPGYGLAKAGMNALEAGDASAAIRLLERATQAAPETAAWHRGLADAYRLAGQSLRSTEEGLRAWELEAAAQQTSGPSGD